MLAPKQRQALNVIYGPFRVGSDWPEHRYVDKRLDRLGVDIKSVFEGIPTGLVVPDAARGNFFPQRDDRLALTVAGISVCEGADEDVALFLRALKFFVRREEEYDPPPIGGQPLLIGTKALIDELGLSASEAARIFLLTRHEVGGLGGGSGSAAHWEFEITPEIRRHVGVETIGHYLAARIVQPRQPPLPLGVDALTLPHRLGERASAEAAGAAPRSQPGRSATVEIAPPP